MKLNATSTLAIAASLWLLNNHPQYRHSISYPVDSISFTVLGPSGETIILPKTTVLFTPGDTVLDISTKALRVNQMPFEVGGAGKGTYIPSIDNLSQFDESPASSWLFSIDGKYPPEGPAELEVYKDSKIEWIYTVDLGKDVGAPSALLKRMGNNFRYI